RWRALGAESRGAAKRYLDGLPKLADTRAANLPESRTRLDQVFFADHGYVFRTRGGIGGQSGFRRCEENMGGNFLVNRSGQRDGQDRIGALVLVPGVDRNNQDRPQPFVRRVDIELDEPDLAAPG